jgi:GTP 3',8-cyclase
MSTRLTDRYGRKHAQLRVSVTDRCNIRCAYCMPAENVSFLPRSELLSFEEITRLVRACSELGIRKVRLTGGEPLVRAQLDRLVAMLHAIPALEEIALTTNAIHLARMAKPLRDAGLHRLNISLDTLQEETFRKLTRRSGLHRVLEGIQGALDAGFERTRLNAVIMPGMNDAEVEDLVGFARDRQLEIRFIEFMPLDADAHWERPNVITGFSLRARVENRFGPLIPVERTFTSQPATDYQFPDMPLRVGFIDSVSQPFCGACDRLRLTAEGQFRNCLFSTTEWDARRVLRGGGTDEDIRELLTECVWGKKAGHGIDSPEFIRPERAMYQIGG